MNPETATDQNIEEQIINTARTLPRNRALQLLDFARFLEAQHLNEELLAADDQSDIDADDEKWDSIFADEKSQHLLKKLAEEALDEYQKN